MTDYLIVGSGLAGIAFAETALSNGKTVKVIDDFSQNSSEVAGGMYNPVILKRFTASWKAKEFLDYAAEFYKNLEDKLQLDFDYKLPVYRKFHSVEEQNTWFEASDKPSLSMFLSDRITNNHYYGINSQYGFGEVFFTGYIDTQKLLNAYRNRLKESGCFSNETFGYNRLQHHEDYVLYNNEKFSRIVFAEGFGLLQNPYFNRLPLDGTKGELLVIKAPGLKVDAIIKSKVFILPLGNDYFKVGATYDWVNKTPEPTEAGKQELLTSLKELISVDFEVVEHLAGIRPTVKDRRPMVGVHPKYSRMFVLNGLGTRGVVLGPSMAKTLYDSIENQMPLDPLIDIKRYRKIDWD